MAIRVTDGRLYRMELETRMPFRFGIATVTRLPHLFVRLTVRIDGTEYIGLAAENLVPKWFIKNPETTPEADIAELLQVIRRAVIFAGEIGEAASPFDLWWELYHRQADWGRGMGLAPLLTNFGVSLVERAIIDAFCRTQDQPFAELLYANAFGIDLGRVYPELGPLAPAEYLDYPPLSRIIARHTVGLSDPLTDAEITDADRLHDGLPQSLEACIRAYGLRHFKIKIGGNPEADAARIQRISTVIDATTADDNWKFSLDGNESYKSAADLFYLSHLLDESESLAPWQPILPHVLFVEQPFHRSFALSDDIRHGLDDLSRWWRAEKIIDESDAAIGDFPRAMELGYRGTSHKNCKGMFKGIANACLARKRGAILSGEDLSTVGPVSLLQDLAVQAALGIESVERNGHHYFAGLSAFPADVQAAMLAAHPDLYRPSPNGFPTLAITNGKIDLTSVNAAPFGLAAAFDPTGYPEV